MPAKKTRKSSTPIAILDDPVSQAHCVALLRGENDLFWHRRIKSLFAEAGFETRFMVREEAHAVWRVALTRTTFNLAPDNDSAVKQLRKVLLQGSIKVERGVFSITDRRGNNLNIVFVQELGAPGFLQGRLRPAKKQGELWPARH